MGDQDNACVIVISAAIKNLRDGTRSPRSAAEVTLKRTYDAMEGNIKQNLSVRESAVSAPMEGSYPYYMEADHVLIISESFNKAAFLFYLISY